MRWSSLCTVILALAVLGLGGCKPKPPSVPPDGSSSSSTQPAPPRDVNPAPQPDPGGDRTQAPWPDDAREATEQAYTQGLLGDVFFDFDRADLSSSARDRLTKNARFLTGDGGKYVVTIEGHCDDRGTNEYNIALGERRANTARDYLISLGVDASRLRTLSYGEERQQRSDQTESCWASNRRAYFRITGTN